MSFKLMDYFYLLALVLFDLLGYLKAEGCNKTYKAFLAESAHLQEYTTFLHRGIEYPTKIGGKGLVDMLEDYGRIKLHGRILDLIVAVSKFLS